MCDFQHPSPVDIQPGGNIPNQGTKQTVQAHGPLVSIANRRSKSRGRSRSNIFGTFFGMSKSRTNSVQSPSLLNPSGKENAVRESCGPDECFQDETLSTVSLDLDEDYDPFAVEVAVEFTNPFSTPPVTPTRVEMPQSPVSPLTRITNSPGSPQRRRHARVTSKMKMLQILGPEASKAVEEKWADENRK